ncbi:MAG: type IV pili methyl-accepting chemotaxis transducer N-terminal domain-containing protein [Rhodocyclaceae bacterium]|nr:type IV pili methyl-accepting chemotaxis transducer N-terminal domain-containing protein [Rhodocyclaceae bacterium]
MHRRNFLRAASVGLACSPFLAPQAWAARSAAPGMTLGAAINKAGRQRMLSQRMSKAWLMLDMDILPDRARAVLKQSMTTFERQLAELGGLTPSEEVRLALVRLGDEWHTCKTVLESPPAPDGVNRLFDANEKVLSAAHALTLAYEKASATPAGRLVNLAGRQRMLSQRMAKFYLFRQLGVQPGVCQSELAKARKDFSSAHEALLAAPETTAAIRSEMGLVAQQWVMFQYAVDNADPVDPKMAAGNAATTSERILEQMEVVVGLYEKLT